MIRWVVVWVVPLGAPYSQCNWDVTRMTRFREQADEQAFAALLDKYGEKIWHFLRSKVGAQDADDLFQEVSLSLFHYLSRQTPSCFLPLALQTARWRVADFFQQRGERDPDVMSLEEWSAQKLQPPQSAQSDDDAKLASLRFLFKQVGLSPDQQEALLLHYVVGFSQQEVAEISQISLEGVRSRLRQAKGKLRHRLNKEALWQTH